MDSMLKPKPSNDPQDIPVVAPDAIRVAPADETPSDPIRDLMRGGSLEPQIHAETDFPAVPPVDTTFRPTAVNDVLAPRRRPAGRRALRAVTAFLLTAFIGGAAVAWNSHGDAVQRLIAEWAPLFAKASSPPPEKTGLPAQPALAAAEVDAANAPTPQTRIAAEAVAPGAAASPDQPSLATMARDLANAGQEIEALKASIEQLKASQQQLLAMVSEKAAVPAARTRKPVQQPTPPRPVAALAPAHRPPPPLVPPPPRQAISASSQPPASAPYVTRQTEPLPPAVGETLADPELPSVPRPPMPLR